MDELKNQSVGDNDSFFAPLEQKLSPNAKHALETFIIAFWRPDQDMTAGELRDALRRLYGDEVDRELEQHWHDRREVIFLREPHKQ